MIAVNTDSKLIFIYEPQVGLSIPIVVNLSDIEVKVLAPRVEEMERDFYSVDSLDDLKSIFPDDIAAIDYALNFSRYYSSFFKSEIDAGDISLSELKDLVQLDYRPLSEERKRDIFMLGDLLFSSQDFREPSISRVLL